MQQLRDIVRAKVDAMRLESDSTARSRADIIAALAGSVPAPAPDGAGDDSTGPIHMCPWHTCAATRHG